MFRFEQAGRVQGWVDSLLKASRHFAPLLPSRRRLASPLGTALCAICLALVGAGQSNANASEIELERDPATRSPVRAPLQAWQSARQSLPEDILIRRVAFAGHGVFVFFSPAGKTGFQARFFAATDAGLEPDEIENREDGMCRAPGVDPEHVAPALKKLLESEAWKRHSPVMDSLVLECFRDSLFWMLMPVPEGGYQAGVTIPTYDVAFDPAGDLQVED